jgi:hypothetical protein
MAPTENETFVTSIEQYQRQLELEFREFEQSLTRRDTTAAGDLDPLDWDDLQAQYDREIQPNLAAEQEIMNEFGARFEVSEFQSSDGPLLNRSTAIHAVYAGVKRLRG